MLFYTCFHIKGEEIHIYILFDDHRIYKNKIANLVVYHFYFLDMSLVISRSSSSLLILSLTLASSSLCLASSILYLNNWAFNCSFSFLWAMNDLCNPCCSWLKECPKLLLNFLLRSFCQGRRKELGIITRVYFYYCFTIYTGLVLFQTMNFKLSFFIPLFLLSYHAKYQHLRVLTYRRICTLRGVLGWHGCRQWIDQQWGCGL